MIHEKAKIKGLLSMISKDDKNPYNFNEEEIDLITSAIYNAGYRICPKDGALKETKKRLNGAK